MTTEHMEELTDGALADDELRQRAIKRLRAKAGFWTHLVVYLAVNAFLVVIWAFTGSDLFWPVFPIVGWGIGVVAKGKSTETIDADPARDGGSAPVIDVGQGTDQGLGWSSCTKGLRPWLVTMTALTVAMRRRSFPAPTRQSTTVRRPLAEECSCGRSTVYAGRA